MLVLTLVVMGVATFLIGCLPPASRHRRAAPVLLVVLRAFRAPPRPANPSAPSP